MQIVYDPFGGICIKEVRCPICNCNFDQWFCPSCGLPKFNCKYLKGRYNLIHSGGDYCFRPELKSFENFQSCSKCYTTNPYGAKYCRNCGEKMQLHAIDKNGHGWMDLGLSVLWSTEEMRKQYSWMRSYTDNEVYDDEYDKLTDEDSATVEWGDKWRMPTWKEVEELIEKCEWEKVIIEYVPDFLGAKMGRYNVNAFKVTGPNGNSIFIPTSKHFRDHDSKSISKNMVCAFWTSTQAAERESQAYRFFYRIHGDYCTSETEKNALWLSTPFNKNTLLLGPILNRRPRASKAFRNPIRPVADKKWQGHI